MTDIGFGALLFGVCLLLVALRMPVAVAMFVVGGFGFASLTSWSAFFNLLNTAPFGRVSNYTLSVLPLFLLMGHLATRAGLSRLLFDAARACVGHRRGGLAVSTIGGCAGFGAVCGSSIATGATMAAVALPEMRRHGYSGALATGTLAAGGTLGILFPPSIILVLYAIITEQSIGKLFLAALLPGVLATLGYSAAISAYVRLNPDAGPAAAPMPLAERIRCIGRAWPVAAIFVTVIGGIYLGVFTPTEAAAIGATAIALVALVSGQLSRAALSASLLDTARATGMIFLILIGAEVFNSFLALSQIPATLASTLGASGLAPMAILIGVLLVYLVLGCVMDSLAMILLTVPVFFPLVTGLDLGYTHEEIAIWFGVMALIAVEIGLITPPIGLNVYAINAMDPGVPLGESFRGTMPFLLSGFALLAIILSVPSVCLWLAGLM
ncbi:MAG: TRAP transporter large permease [Rhodospirillaceae bacterium]|nr:TRAP transporter large permease [Rhodospirillaceae bacterium]MDE0000043.1 TRAP transporter large permease [Rhodospirillaceae bacterium]MDE0363688.1 TRAP transporter large permease [Rhodospirillaceae bacterium]